MLDACRASRFCNLQRFVRAAAGPAVIDLTKPHRAHRRAIEALVGRLGVGERLQALAGGRFAVDWVAGNAGLRN